MFESIKFKKRQKELEELKESIIKEKKELEAIKQLLEDKSRKIDISNVYVFTYGGISYLVTLEKVNNNYRRLRDIFNKQVLIEYYKSSIDEQYQVYMECNERFNGEDSYATLVPIIDKTPDFLIFVNRQVPEYLLQQYLYKLNNIYITNYVKSK